MIYDKDNIISIGSIVNCRYIGTCTNVNSNILLTSGISQGNDAAYDAYVAADVFNMNMCEHNRNQGSIIHKNDIARKDSVRITTNLTFARAKHISFITRNI